MPRNLARSYINVEIGTYAHLVVSGVYNAAKAIFEAMEDVTDIVISSRIYYKPAMFSGDFPGDASKPGCTQIWVEPRCELCSKCYMPLELDDEIADDLKFAGLLKRLEKSASISVSDENFLQSLLKEGGSDLPRTGTSLTPHRDNHCFFHITRNLLMHFVEQNVHEFYNNILLSDNPEKELSKTIFYAVYLGDAPSAHELIKRSTKRSESLSFFIDEVSKS